LNDDEIRYYHAGLSREEKGRLESWFLSADNGILCATCAYGMGIDKSNVRTVVHLSPPASTEAYLQESGRASRDGKGANAWLIWTAADSSDTPANGSSKNRVVDRSMNSGSERDFGDSGSTGELSQPSTAAKPAASPEAVARSRRSAMIRYATSNDRCRREMLLDALDIETQDCSGCDVCGGEPWTAAPEEDVILKVIRWNRGRFRKGQLARILIGRRTAEIRRAGLDTVRGFGVLAGWELEDAEEAIGVLLQIGKIRFRTWIWTTGKLIPENVKNV